MSLKLEIWQLGTPPIAQGVPSAGAKITPPAMGDPSSNPNSKRVWGGWFGVDYFGTRSPIQGLISGVMGLTSPLEMNGHVGFSHSSRVGARVCSPTSRSGTPDLRKVGYRWDGYPPVPVSLKFDNWWPFPPLKQLLTVDSSQCLVTLYSRSCAGILEVSRDFFCFGQCPCPLTSKVSQPLEVNWPGASSCHHLGLGIVPL